MVCGSSATSASARPISRAPRWGDSRRASATWALIPLPRSRAGTPLACWRASCDALKSTASRAGAAAAAALTCSKRPIRSIRCASSAASDGLASAATQPTRSAGDGALDTVAVNSIMCSIILLHTDRTQQTRRLWTST